MVVSPDGEGVRRRSGTLFSPAILPELDVSHIPIGLLQMKKRSGINKLAW